MLWISQAGGRRPAGLFVAVSEAGRYQRTPRSHGGCPWFAEQLEDRLARVGCHRFPTYW